MLETWIICELANAGNLQDAVMHHNGGAFFYENMPHMVRGVSEKEWQLLLSVYAMAQVLFTEMSLTDTEV
jgi:hypothetical protein